MKTILWATLSANGNYAQSSPENPPKKEAFDDFVKQARAAGNLIVGRRTFEGMLSSGGAVGGPFSDLDIVVVSKNVGDLQGVTVARSPQEALNYLQKKGRRTPRRCAQRRIAWCVLRPRWWPCRFADCGGTASSVLPVP